MSKKALYAFLVSFILMVAVIIINRQSFNKMQEYTFSVDRGRQIMARFEKLSNHFKSAQIYSEQFHSDSTNTFYEFYKKEADSVKSEIASLQWMVAGDRAQKIRMDSVGKHISEIMPLLMEKNIVEIVNEGNRNRLEKLLHIQTQINNGIDHERRLLARRSADQQQFTNLTRTYTLLFSVIALLIVIITFVTLILISRKRQWLEGFLSSILNTTPNGVMTFKTIRINGEPANFEIEYVNKAIEKFFNTKSEDIVGKKLDELPLTLTFTELMEKFRGVMDHNQKEAFEMQIKTGFRPRWFYIMLAKMEDGITATFHDISVVKKYEDELKDNIRKLEHSNIELEQYAYAASHDLQEPLRKIRMYVSRLNESLDGRMDQKEQHDINRIMISAERMSVLIRDILSFSGINRESAFQLTDLNKIVQHVMDDQEVLIQQKNASIQLDQLPVIEAIPLQMNQLFYNLLNNALKFSREEVAPTINITCNKLTAQDIRKHKRLKSGYEYVQISFADNGVGFDVNFSEQIFGLFKRLGNQEKVHGSGIGLALCRKVVENHHGIIFATGRENEGAKFTIILPTRQSKPTAEQVLSEPLNREWVPEK